MRLRWRHIIFDLDGTLVDTVEDIAAALNHALVRFGLAPRSVDAVREMVGEGARRLVEQALPNADEQTREQVLQAFLESYRANPVVHSRLYPCVQELLQKLKEHGGVATVLTNKPFDLSEEILRRLGLSELVGVVCGGDTLPQRKPDPAGVFYLCERVGRGIGDTLLVGDSGIDRMTATRAGVAFCAALWGYRPAELTGEGLVAQSPGDLAGLVFLANAGSVN
ncbi:Phosphoglycolate phosphatase [bacterium HR30]|nr:Phosphoglycolate phosphatase [bacterium HR30]